MINEELLSPFPEGEMKKTLEEVIEAAECLSQKEPVYGFYPRFVVPGWISLIQMLCVESKMDKFCRKPFYDGDGYREFINWIANKANTVANHLPEIQSLDEETNDRCKKQVIAIFDSLVEVWRQCCPEVASYPNCYLNDNVKISPYCLLHYGLADILKDLGYPQVNVDSNGKSSKTDFSGEMKERSWYLVGYIINTITFLCILGIISAIFS